MTKLEKLEAEIKNLSSEEVRKLYNWLSELQADQWDEQIAADSKSDKLEALANAALAAHKAGQTKPL